MNLFTINNNSVFYHLECTNTQEGQSKRAKDCNCTQYSVNSKNFNKKNIYCRIASTLCTTIK